MIQHQLEAAGAVQGDLHKCPFLPYIDITQSQLELRKRFINHRYGVLVGTLNHISISENYHITVLITCWSIWKRRPRR
jgi:hypothetical protein